MFVGNEWSYGHKTLIDIRGDISIEYSGLHLDSIALLGVALWGDEFLSHHIASRIARLGYVS